MRLRAIVVDHVLLSIWQRLGLDEDGTRALVAVGGYGRGELHPFSDVDILVLLAEDPEPGAVGPLSDFLTALWDIGLDIGHSVRTVEQCAPRRPRT